MSNSEPSRQVAQGAPRGTLVPFQFCRKGKICMPLILAYVSISF